MKTSRLGLLKMSFLLCSFMVGFCRASDNTVAANRAYLQSTTDAVAVSLNFEDLAGITNTNLSNLTNEATAINIQPEWSVLERAF